MKAIILAAGKGSRLLPITLSKPKGLLEIGNETILDRLIRQFRQVGIDDILIVVGYQKDKIISHFGSSVRFLEYSDYDKTNNLHTLWSVRDEIKGDVIITFSDLVLQNNIIGEMLENKNEITLAVDTSRVLDGTMKVKVENGMLQNIKTTTADEASGNFIGLASFNNAGCEKLVSEMATLVESNYDDYYTLAIDKMARRGNNVGFHDVAEQLWREIDTQDEYDEVRTMSREFNE